MLSTCAAGHAESNTLTGPIPIDEIDAGCLESVPNSVKRQASRIMSTCLELADGHDANESSLGQIGLAPAE
jgi:hypothetical protein